MTANEAKETIRSMVLKEFLPGEDPANLTDTTPLVTGGVLDSIATLKLVALLEETFGIKVAAHEVGADNLNTVALIANFVDQKLA